ncbi:MAG TPA: beta-galactosidase [Candidatus Fimivicinus intestinavium]|nr:beta-galactosidase [Candidatus Fimivicinus intestinavium]
MIVLTYPPRSEYPRPQFFRNAWQTLNGEWAFHIDHGKSGRDRGQSSPQARFDQKILIPFCPESKLSGVAHLDFMESVWYKRSVTLTQEQLAGRVLLHFGAVDYSCTIYVNGEACGTHQGGYSSFQFDITEHVHPGENTLTVHAVDHQRDGTQPHGKQCDHFESSGCSYTRTTGIWQSVWLEFVPTVYLQSVRLTADYRTGSVTLCPQVSSLPRPLSLRVSVSFKGEPCACETFPLSACGAALSLHVDDVKCWDVLQPNLYDVTYELCDGAIVLDTVQSYFGFRTVELREHAIWLNGRPVFQRLVLDQGYYPDGVYTAPTDDALRRDIELSIALGFNGARLHQKVFEERFLYWADRLGYLVWGEQASWGLDITTSEGLLHFLPEWLEVLSRDFNHPCIIGWCPFNETWDQRHRRADKRVLEAVYLATKAADPTRPVIDTSGNYHARTDIYDVHDYEQDVKTFAARYNAVTREAIYETYPDRQQYEGQPYFVSEYGGAWWAPGQDKGWGYGKAPESEAEFAQRYAGLTRALMDNPNICALCYTQLYDVEQEQNGLYTYERKPKFSQAIYEQIQAVNSAPAALERQTQSADR